MTEDKVQQFGSANDSLVRPRLPVVGEPVGITVGMMLDSLGADVVLPLALPNGRDVRIGSPTIYDPEQAGVGLADSVLLVPGRPTADLLDWSAIHGASAVVVRNGAVDVGPWVKAARRAGVSLLECAEEMTWGQLYTLIDALRAMTGPVSESDGQRSADLFWLANDVALRVGGAVAIEDLSMRVLAYSTIPGQEVDDQRRDGILGRRVPDHPANVEEYSAVLRSATAVWSTSPAEYRPRLAIAIRDSGEALGSIWVLQGGQPLASDAAEVLADAARLAAQQLAQLNLAADADRRQRAERMSWLITGTGATRDIAHGFGLTYDAPASVLVVDRYDEQVGPRGAVTAESAAAYVSDLLRMGLSAYRFPAVASSIGGQTVAVVGTTADSSVLQLITATVLARAIDSLGPGWRAGISRTMADLSDIPAGVFQARQAWAVACRPFGHGDIGRHAELGVPMFLLDVYDDLHARRALDGEPLSLVIDHDAKYETNYVTSLRSWIASNYDVVRAAEELVLHPNTLRHRLRRMAEVIDLDDPDLRLALALQLRLREIGISHDA